jgi:colanic acid/amylovoran biosynthesis glycosyltransferase
MNICLVVNSFPSVSETFITNKVLGLAQRGHTIHVVKTSNEASKELESVYNFAALDIHVYNLAVPASFGELIKAIVAHPLYFVQSLSTNAKTFKQKFANKLYQSVFSKISFDIIHFEFSGVGVNFLSLIDNLQGKKVVSCRGTAEKVKLLTDVQRQKNLATLFSKVDAIHCVSTDMQHTVAPYCNDSSKFFVNRPAIDAQFFLPATDKPTNNVLQIITIGRFTFQKGYLIGLLAIKQLVSKGINLQWNIIGDGPQKEELQFHINELQLASHVNLLGKKNKNEVNDLLNAADLFLLTSFYEGIPNVVLEAMSKQLPVVTTRCGGVDEVIENGVDGFIAELYNHQQLAGLIENLATNTSLRIQMGKAAREKILQAFTIERQMNVFEEEYGKLLAGFKN